MVEKKWQVITPTGKHQVELSHNPFTGALAVAVDGDQVLHRERKLNSPGLELNLSVGGQSFLLRMERYREAFCYTLEKDGRPMTPREWPLPPGPLNISGARENIRRELIYSGLYFLMVLLCLIFISDDGAFAGLLIFGTATLLSCYRWGQLLVARIELNRLGITQRRLTRNKTIAWQEVEQVYVDPLGQCRITGRGQVITLQAGVFEDLRALAWWIEFMAETRAVAVPRLGEWFVLRHGRKLLPIAILLAGAGGVWLDRVPLLIGVGLGLGAGLVWGRRVGTPRLSGIPFSNEVLAGLVLIILLDKVGFMFFPLLALGLVTGFLLYYFLARRKVVRNVNNQGLYV